MGALRAGYEVASGLTLVRRLGAGGMGTVWLAQSDKLKTEVVVKFLSESLTTDPDACARFSREVVATARVRSPHVVQLLDHGITESGVPFIVMELLEGQDLAKTLRQRKRLGPDEVYHIIEGVSAALTRAHALGIVHRDIKPANIFLCAAPRRPFVKLVDFGIARRLEDETITATDALIGTPTYMSPEQLSSSAVDHRTDLWALGVLTYHTLTGAPPFAGGHIAAIAHAIISEPRPKIRRLRPDLPLELDEWLERALANNADDRFQSASELADALARALGDFAVSTTKKMDARPRRSSAPPPSARSPAVVIQPTPSGPMLHPAESSPRFDTEGATLDPSSLTRPPHRSSSSRAKWTLVAVVVSALGLIGGAFRIGYGLRAPAQRAAPEESTTPSNATAPSTNVEGEPRIDAALASSDSVDAGARPASSRPTRSTKRSPRADIPDDIGF